MSKIFIKDTLFHHSFRKHNGSVPVHLPDASPIFFVADTESKDVNRRVGNRNLLPSGDYVVLTRRDRRIDYECLSSHSPSGIGHPRRKVARSSNGYGMQRSGRNSNERNKSSN